MTSLALYDNQSDMGEYFEANSNQSIESITSNYSDFNKNLNIGLSLESQELIVEFHQTICNVNLNYGKQFEEIVRSFLDDVSKYKRDIERLEDSYKSDKKNNDEKMRNMIDEAENQFKKIKNEKIVEYETKIEKLKQQQKAELELLQDKTLAMQENQTRTLGLISKDVNEISDLKAQVRILKEENQDLKQNVTQYEDEVEFLKNQLNDLACSIEQINDKSSTIMTIKEINKLKHEIYALHNANLKLNSTNDLLRKVLESLRQKSIDICQNTSEEVSKYDILHNDLIYNDKKSKNRCIKNYKRSENAHDSSSSVFVSDDDQESGYLPSPSSRDSSRCLFDDSFIFVDKSHELDEFNQQCDLNQGKIKPRLDKANNIYDCVKINYNQYNKNENESDMSDISLLYNNLNINNSVEKKLANENKRKQSKLNSYCEKIEKNFKSFKLEVLNQSKSLEEHKLNIFDKPSLKHEEIKPILDSNLNKISPENNRTTQERMFKVVFAGDSSVGKTSFIVKYCMDKFIQTSATLGVDFHMKTLQFDNNKITLQLWDTCGTERFHSVAKSYFRRADGVVLMYDCSNIKSFNNIKEWLHIIEDSSDRNIPIIIIGNKIDLRDSNRMNKQVVEYDEGLKLAKDHESLFIETSAKEGTNIDLSLIEICRKMTSKQDNEIKDTIKLDLISRKKNSCC